MPKLTSNSSRSIALEGVGYPNRVLAFLGFSRLVEIIPQLVATGLRVFHVLQSKRIMRVQRR